MQGYFNLSNFAHNLERIIKDTDIEHVIISNMGDMLGTIKGTLVNFIVKYVKKMVPNYSIDNVYSFKQAISIGKIIVTLKLILILVI